jgi:hypothetical protein
MKKRDIQERCLIDDSPRIRPYGAKLLIKLEKNTEIKAYESSLLLSHSVIVRMRKEESQSIFYTEDVKRYQRLTENEVWSIFVEGFSTAGEAERIGMKVALGILYASIQGQFFSQLLYNTPLPCSVYIRDSQNSQTSSGSCATITRCMPLFRIADAIDEILSSVEDVDEDLKDLLVAAELFASSQLEYSERAKFISLISSLEPLAKQKEYQFQGLEDAIKQFSDQISKLDLDGSTEYGNSVKNSLRGRAKDLKRESVRQAIKSLVLDVFKNDREKVNLIDEAYNTRSKILHEGFIDADLPQTNEAISDTI